MARERGWKQRFRSHNSKLYKVTEELRLELEEILDTIFRVNNSVGLNVKKWLDDLFDRFVRFGDDIFHQSVNVEGGKMLAEILSKPHTRKIFYFFLVNLGFMFVEAFVGLWTNSLGLVSDAGHMLFDCTALLLGLVTAYVSNWQADSQFSYGYARFELMSGFVNGVFLMFVAIYILRESFERLSDPPEMEDIGLLLVTSILGLFVNIGGIIIFADSHSHSHARSHSRDGHWHDHEYSHEHGHEHAHESHDENEKGDKNMEGVYLHVLADLLGSIGVVISSIFAKYFNWHLGDPICSAVISVMILYSVMPLLKSTAEDLLLMTPPGMQAKFNRCLRKIHEMEDVVAIHEPHLFRYSSSSYVLTMQIIIDPEAEEQQVLLRARECAGQLGKCKCVIQIVRPETLKQIGKIEAHSEDILWDPDTENIVTADCNCDN